MIELQTLSDLLADLFSAPELLDWIRRLPDGEHLPRELADRAPATLAADAEALLRRHGYVDATLFDALVAVRPRREAEIRAVQGSVLARKPPARPNQTPPSPTPTSRFGPIHNHGPSQQGDGNTMTVQTAAGGMIFNGPVTVSGGHVGPVHHAAASAATPAAPRAPAPRSTSAPKAPASPSTSALTTASAASDPRLSDLCALIAKRQVLVICGAGVSLAATGGASVAGWKGLLQSGARWCGEWAGADAKWVERQLRMLDEGDTEEWIDVAGRITTKLGGAQGGEYKKWLRETVGSLKVVDSSLPQAIRALGCPIATTNYDHLLESETELRPVSWDERSEVDRALRGDDPGVLHLHGHWRRPESVVLGRASYLSVAGDPHADAIRKALRTIHSLLFIGCGATTEDPNLSAWLAWSGEVFAGSEYRSYRLEKDADVARVQAGHPPEQRIRVLGYGADHGALPGFLRGLVA